MLVKCFKLSDIEQNILKYDVICIDEIQFYEDNIYCDNGQITTK